MSFVGLYSGLSGIRAAQTGVDVASHNVANANTSGYTRQRVDLTPRPTYDAPAGRVGTGVEVEAITRLRDQFLDARYRDAIGEGEHAAVRGDLLGRLEQLASEPEEGVTARLGALWDAVETWANDPDDSVSRRQVLNGLASLTDTIRRTAGAWDSLAADADERRDAVATEVSGALEALADLDARIANADPSRVGADLHDERDRLLDDLAELTGADARIADDGRSRVRLGGVDLVTADGVATVAISGDDVVVTDTAGDTHTVEAGGAIGGLHTFLHDDLPRFRTALDDVAESLTAEVNTVNTLEGYAAEDPDATLLTFDGGDAAGSLEVTTADPAALNASVDGPDGEPHDASNAERLASLRFSSVIDPDAPALDERVDDVVVDLAAEVRAARMHADAAGGVASGADLARAAEHGVSIDEEMVDLVRYQRAMESASRVMTTVDEMLDVLVNRTGVVGR